jgi:hypothetical protein
MAQYYAIGAIGQAIREVLLTKRPPEFPSLPVDIYRAKDFEHPFDEGISIYLYRLSLSTGRRNRTPFTSPDGVRHQPPVEVDLHYMITPWARQGDSQQFLLGWMVRTLADAATLPPPLLNSGAYPDVFGPTESVQLIQDSLTLADLNNLWNVASVKEQASAYYITQMVALESRRPVTEADPVRTRIFQIGEIVA